eukprot:g8434.t1
MPNIDVVYHLAAAVGVKLVADDPVRTIETNIYPTESLLQLAVQGKKRFFLASTSEVFGKNPLERWTEEDDLHLGPTSRPRWAYGCSKAIDEFLALAYHQKYGLDVVIGRFFNVVGPRQVGNYGMVVPRFVEAALEGRALTVYDDGAQPVILLLAALPGLIVLESQPANQLTSSWGLRAIDALNATDVIEAVAPGEARYAAKLRFQPPLATWLTVGAMRVMGPMHPLSAMIVSYFAAAGVLGMSYVLMSRLMGGRVGFWTVVLLAGHPSGLELFRAPPPVPLTLLFAMIAFWGIVRHRDDAEASASVSLMVAGVSLGLCLLSGGIAVVAVATILGVTVSLKKEPARSRQASGNEQRRRKKRLTRSVVSTIAVLLTGFAVGGWWLLMLGARFGSEFWHEWVFETVSKEQFDLASLLNVGHSVALLLGVFGVAAIVGFIRSAGLHKSEAAGKPSASRMTLIVVWVIVAFCVYVLNAMLSDSASWRGGFASSFLLIPLLACAAVLLDDIFQRRIGLNFVALLAMASVLNLVMLPFWSTVDGAGQFWSLRYGGAAAIVTILAVGLICRFASRSEGRRRIAIGGLVGCLLTANVVMAVNRPYDGNLSEERELKLFMASIPSSIDVDRCLLITTDDATARVEYAIRSRWPMAEFATIDTWNAAIRDRAGQITTDDRRTLVVEWMTAKEHPTKIDFPGFQVFGDAEFVPAAKAVPGMYEVTIGHFTSVEQAVAGFTAHAAVEFAEPNYRIQLAAFSPPNDPLFDDQWALHNTGQGSGTEDADIDALEAWSVTTGDRSVVVAVIDTGIDYAHTDLAANMWFNSGEIPWNGVDDDGNGFVDDVHGYDFVNNDGDPSDDHGHGTHVAGTIAAVGDNGTGVVGVAPGVRLMALKFLDAAGNGYISDAVRALDYAVAMGATISNNSWGGGVYSSAMVTAISNAKSAEHIFVAAAGNRALNNDYNASYPASYPNDNIVAVAATDRNDNRSSFSNIGPTSVDLAAPGSSVYSTLPGNQYGVYSGTSMASPHVAGVIALVRSQHPDWSYRQVIDQVLNTVDPLPSLNDRILTGGRVNAARAVGVDIPYQDLYGGDAAHSATIGTSTTISARINEPGDQDWFNIKLNAGKTYAFETGLGTLSDSIIRLYDTDGTTLLRIDDNGGSGLASRIQFTSQATGTYYVSVAGVGGATGTYVFQPMNFRTVGVPTIVAPAGDDYDTTPTIGWTTTTGADHYELMVYDVAGGNLAIDESNVSGTSFTPSTGLPAGRTYQAWVRGISAEGEIGDWSRGHTLTVTLPGRPSLSGPGSSTTDTKPRISWSAVDGADRYELLMFNATSGAQVLRDAGLSATQFEPPTHLPVRQTYEVFVRSLNDQGDPGEWSAPLTFSVHPPSPPALNSPQATTGDKTPTLDWASSPAAVGYDLLVYDLHAGRLIEQVDDVSATSHTINTTLPLGTAGQVFLRGRNAAGDVGNWGAPSVFRVTGPPAPTVTAPAASTSDASPTIQWTTSAHAASYDLLVYNIGVGAVVRHVAGITATEFTPPSGLSAGATFQAFVRGVNADGEAGDWSAPHQFSTTVNAAGVTSTSVGTDDAESATVFGERQAYPVFRFDDPETTVRRDASPRQPLRVNRDEITFASARFQNGAQFDDDSSTDDDDSPFREDERDEVSSAASIDIKALDAVFADQGFDLTAALV